MALDSSNSSSLEQLALKGLNVNYFCMDTACNTVLEYELSLRRNF